MIKQFLCRKRLQIKQKFCKHRFDYKDLISRPTPDGDVTWTCWKCNKEFKAHCGLYILDHGEVKEKE